MSSEKIMMKPGKPIRAVAWAWVCFTVCGVSAWAQDALPAESPEAPPPQGLRADELVVLLSDHFSETYNAEGRFENSLPGFARLSRRARAKPDQRLRPMPIGVISFTGTPPESLDVLIELKDADPYYAWPPATTSKDTRLLWARLALDRDEAAVPQLDDPEHWLSTLRAPESLVIHANRKAAHALLYDVRFQGKNPLTLGKSDETYTAAVAEGASVREAFLFKPAEGQTTRAVRIAFADEDHAPTTRADAVHPTAEAALATLSAALTDAQVPAHLAQHAAATVKRFLEDEAGQMVAVAWMRPGFMQERMPIEITPAPAASSRHALIVIVNADPDLLGQIDGLIAQLGDAAWAKRHAAHEQLSELGEIARNRLEANQTNKDPEIAFRVHALLEVINAGELNKDQ